MDELYPKNSRIPMFMKYIGYWIKKLFFILTIQQDGVCILPYSNIQSKWCSKFLIKGLVKLNKKVVLSKPLSKNKLLQEGLEKNNILTLNGKKLFFYLSYQVIEYIEKMRNKDIHKEEVSILINTMNQQTQSLIMEFAKNVKRINIVTRNRDAFIGLENYLETELGISITITNNKKKSLLKSKIILNLDFSEEEINKYSINREAMVINIQENIKIQTKTFVGIIINDYEIRYQRQEEEKWKMFEPKLLYESYLENQKDYQTILEKMRQDKVKIINLMGINGIIDRKEFLRI